jgi:hypothetical protein
MPGNLATFQLTKLPLYHIDTVPSEKPTLRGILYVAHKEESSSSKAAGEKAEAD